MTYIAEKHWIFEHSGKTYSRDLFLFVILVFFAYGFYTIKPIHDLTLLGREQTEGKCFATTFCNRIYNATVIFHVFFIIRMERLDAVYFFALPLFPC